MTTDTKEIVFFGPAGDPTNNDEDTAVPSDDRPPEISRPPSPVPSTPIDTNCPFLGLKIYTPEEVSVSIKGQVRQEMKAAFEGLTVADWNSFSM